MSHAVRYLARPLPAFCRGFYGARIGFGQKIAMASVSTASNGAGGKPNPWHGAGAAAFDLRSELGFAYMVLVGVEVLKPQGNLR